MNRILSIPCILMVGILAAGCGVSVNSPINSKGGSGASFYGAVTADGKPVAGASVQLFAAGTSGNGSTASALLTTALDTGADGSFTVPSGYSCDASTAQVYLIARGGTPASSSGENNSLALMSALGTCTGITAGSAVTVNEATTVAAVAPLAAFYSAGGNIGASSTNAVGLANAFTTAANLVNVSTGISPGASVPATLTVSRAKLNTLANALAVCTAASSVCAPLFAAATPSSGLVPDNTLDAVFNILRYPANNVAAIYQVASGTTVFSPALAAAPPDWMLFTTWTGGGINEPTSIAIDASGNLWAAGYPGAVSAWTPGGEALAAAGFTGGGLDESWGLAVAPSGSVWITDYASQSGVNNGYGAVTELNSDGTALSGADGYFSGGIEWPIAVAADTNGDIWVVNNWETVTRLSSSGSPLSGANGWGLGQLDFPVAVAIDAQHNAWVANQSGDTITSIAPDGSLVNSYSCCDGPAGIATDEYGYVWAANYYGNSLSVVTTSGAVVSSGLTGGGINDPQGIAVDGAGTVWLTNYHSNSLSEVSGAKDASMGAAMSPAFGFGSDASLSEPYAIAIDASGNLWVSNHGNSTITQFIGVATPVKTPLAGPPKSP